LGQKQIYYRQLTKQYLKLITLVIIRIMAAKSISPGQMLAKKRSWDMLLWEKGMGMAAQCKWL